MNVSRWSAGEGNSLGALKGSPRSTEDTSWESTLADLPMLDLCNTEINMAVMRVGVMESASEFRNLG